MVLDYRERKPVGKNRPRKQPVKSLAFSFVIVAALAYGAGILTGRILFGTRMPVEGQVGAVQQTEQRNMTSANPGTVDKGTAEEPPFTFYETLPKGGKAVIGSGINHSIAEQGTAAQKSTPTSSQFQPPSVTTEKPQLSTQQSPRPDVLQQQAVPRNDPAPTQPLKTAQLSKTVAEKGKFAIQVASCQSRKDAEEIKSRYSASGVAAYIVESNVPGKGVWYRVRLGKGLDHEKAKEMAVKFGKSAIVIPEHEL